MLRTLSIPTLAARRKQLKLCTFFSCVNGLSIAPNANLIHRVTPFQSRHMHDLSFVCPIAHTNQYIILFSPIATIHLWNNLPDFVVHSNSLDAFKHSLQLIIIVFRMYASISCTLFHASFAFMHKFRRKKKKKKKEARLSSCGA